MFISSIFGRLAGLKPPCINYQGGRMVINVGTNVTLQQFNVLRASGQ
jgi:hypothetical protein